jgi:hypothetical protein
MVDLTNKIPIPGEGICSECGENKRIVALEGGQVLCEDCSKKRPSANCAKCGKKIDSSKKLPLCDECEREYKTE